MLGGANSGILDAVTPTPVKSEHFEAEGDLEKARLRLYDAASDLRPLHSPDDLAKRVRAVARELQDIQESLLLYVHCAQLEHDGLDETLAEIDKQLSTGWQPEGSPVEVVIARLRERLQAS